MGEPDPTPVLSYAHGRYEPPSRTVWWLIGLDVAFGTVMILINGWVAYWSLRYPPQAFDEELGVTPNVANPLMATEAIASLLMLLLLAAAALRLLSDRASGVRLHRLYARVKLALAVCFGILSAVSYRNEVTFPPNDGGEAAVAGIVLFVLSALHPTIVLNMLQLQTLGGKSTEAHIPQSAKATRGGRGNPL
jgi:hypothetical protein